MSGVLKLGNSRDTSAIPLLARAREREADPEVQAVLEEGLAILRRHFGDWHQWETGVTAMIRNAGSGVD